MKAYNNRFSFIVSGIHYVYIYYDPDTHEPFYVGKGKNDRAFFHLTEKIRSGAKINYSKLNKIKDIKNRGKLPVIQFVSTCKAEKQAYTIEQDLILSIGTLHKNNGPLTNIIMGGGRIYDCEDSKNIYEKISKSQKEGFQSGRLIPHNKGKKMDGTKNGRYGDHRNYEEIHGEEKSNAIKKNFSAKRIGSGNSNAKTYKFVDPQNNEYIVTGECELFCKEKDLSMNTLKKHIGSKVHYVFLPNVKHPNTEGWSLQEYENNNV